MIWVLPFDQILVGEDMGSVFRSDLIGGDIDSVISVILSQKPVPVNRGHATLSFSVILDYTFCAISQVEIQRDQDH